MVLRSLTCIFFAATQITFATFLPVNSVCAQSSEISDDVILTVEGRVADVFQSATSNQDYLVKILVQKSLVEKWEDVRQSNRYPAPGEYVYVHVKAVNRNSRGNDNTSSFLPRVNSHVRARLRGGDHQDWWGASQNWYQALEDVPESITAGEQFDLGVKVEIVFVSSRRALKVTKVNADSPAAQAGLEVGDVLVAANGVDVSSQDQLNDQVKKSNGVLQLVVRDVRTGRDVPVEVKWTQPMRGDAPSRNPRVRGLGVTTEVAFFNGNAALKVVEVAQSSPAQSAGIVAGEIVLTANGNSLSKPENLIAAERESNGILTLRVVEPKTRVERDVRVDLR